MATVLLLFLVSATLLFFLFFFFNDTATTEIYTLSLHDALPICPGWRCSTWTIRCCRSIRTTSGASSRRASAGPIRPSSADRKSTRLNSSHLVISYAVFCLKKKNKHHQRQHPVAHHAIISECRSD